jgi:hypothetical protein
MGKKVYAIFRYRDSALMIPRISFNITLLLVAIFVLAAGASTDWMTLLDSPPCGLLV